jgi:outer membrane protein OmpA-like peptidoglycan-associated protein
MKLYLNGDEDRNYWAAFGDIALATLLIFILGVLSQFHKVLILQTMEGRQQEVKARVEQALPDGSIQVVKLDYQHQQLTFSSDLLFILWTVGQILKEKEGYFEAVQVVGHTDVQSPTGCDDVADNWELASQRATNVVRLLTAEELLPPELLSSIGRGEFHPVDLTSYGPNRRIELVLQYSERNIVRELDSSS